MALDSEWLAQATILRNMAEVVADPGEKRKLLTLAADCERVAKLRAVRFAAAKCVSLPH